MKCLKKISVTLVLTIIAVAVSFCCFGLCGCDTAQSSDVAYEQAVLTKIVDGDTLTCDVNGQSQKVRLIGVDCAESVHPDATKNTQEGTDASNFTKSYLKIGQILYLEKDVSDTDKYGRLLRYVWLEKPVNIDKDKITTKMFNSVLVGSGYAVPKDYPPDTKYSSYFHEIYDTVPTK